MNIDINCDLGEGETQFDCDRDALLMPYITRCNIACGGHAGNELTMKLSIENAIINNLKIGAHPGYPDYDNFGRISIEMPFKDLEKSLLEQIHKLQKICTKFQISLDHIKFHGALYNDIENSYQLAENIASLISLHYPTLNVICLAEGFLMKSCLVRNILILKEAFIDRRYMNSKKLSPRTMEGSVIESQEQAIEQAISLAYQESIQTIDKRWISIKADTLCLHGDNKNSHEIARKLHKALIQKGIKVQQGLRN